ncbi:serine/threonine-protein kinase [Streptomyces sp. NBC_01304]|uniref:serine/threonine-protein kinase n=1 Tax=Streptomyces sp. NBC_01304 TaxID=2903818 RepID=UPI002E166468|nr:serine/threonine protein kinase [Streptomyces sp. NBC_01304]
MKPLGPADPATAGPYRLLAELGQGGMGRVLLGAAPDGRLVAVKQVHARFAADDGFRARFRREVAASRQVSGAYTAAVLDADTEAQLPWLASAFVGGPSLGSAVEDAGVLPEAAVRRLAAGLATALVEIHRAGIVHRDLKPENVLLAADGVRVIDFGIARVAEGAEATALTHTGWMVGSPSFMSPEQAEGQELTPASDVFALGAVLAMAATGDSPFSGTSMAGTLYNVVHAEPDLTTLPPGLAALIGPCLAKAPADRPTPQQLLALLGPITPAERPWPPSVHGLIATQQTEIDRLLDATDRAPAPDPYSPTWVSPPAPAPAPAPGPGFGPPLPFAGTPPRGRKMKITALVLAGVLAVAGIGVGAYVLTNRGDDTDASSGPPDKYTKIPTCAEAAGQLGLPERDKNQDSSGDSTKAASTGCTWMGTQDLGNGYVLENAYTLAHVRWTLERTVGDDKNATGLQREEFAEDAADGTRDSGLGIGDEAYWEGSNPAPDEHCELRVRDGNMIVWVRLGGDEHPESTCKADAAEIARAALAAIPD